MKYILIALIAYFVGNISGSIIVSKLGFSEDIRTKGSGNAGTTNVLRTYGLNPAFLTLLIDGGKGYLACYLASLIDTEYGIYLAGVMVVVGHCWPVVMGFRGGKGVATSAGVMLFHTPVFMISALVIFFVMNFTIKIMSVTSLTLTLYTLIYVIVKHWFNSKLLIMVVIMALIVIFSHRENIDRIKKGTEGKITIKKG